MKDIKDFINESINEGLNNTLQIIDTLAKCKDNKELEKELLKVLPVKNKSKCKKALFDIYNRLKNQGLPGFYSDPDDNKSTIYNLAGVIDARDMDKKDNMKKFARIVAGVIEKYA